MIIKTLGLILFFSSSQSQNLFRPNLPAVSNNLLDLLNIIHFFDDYVNDHNLYLRNLRKYNYIIYITLITGKI